MAWQYTPVSFRGTSLESGNLRAYFLADQGPVQLESWSPVEVEVIGSPPRDLRAQPEAGWLLLEVRLLAFDEPDVSAFYRLFDPELGPGTLVIRDGAGAQWQASARPVARPVTLSAPDTFQVALRLADPVWQAVSLSQLQAADQTGDQVGLSPNVAGNRRTRPVLRITRSGKRTDATKGWTEIRRGVLVNRAPDPLVETPVYMFPAAQDYRQAIANRSPEHSVTTTAAITATSTSIPYGSRVGDGVPTAGMGILSDGHDWEQVSWTAGGGGASGTLTGVTRGIGGTVARSWGSGAKLYASQLLYDARDLRVFLRGVEVDRWVVGAALSASVAATTTQAFSGASTVSLTHNTRGYQAVLLVGIAHADGSDTTTSSVTAAGVALTQADRREQGSQVAEWWILSAPPQGDVTITVQLSGAATGAVVAHTILGANTLTMLTSGAGGTGATAAASISGTAGGIALDLLSTGNVTATPEAAQKERVNTLSSTVRACSSSEPYLTTGTIQLSWTLSASATWVMSVVSLAPLPDYTAGGNVVTVLSVPAARSLTLASDITPASPANGGELPVSGALERVPSSGLVLVDSELIAYDGVDLARRVLRSVKRGVLSSSAAAHAGGATVWVDPEWFHVVHGWAGAGPAPSPQARRPAIELPTSSNTTWRWGSELNDPDTAIIGSRPASWTPLLVSDGSPIAGQIRLEKRSQIIRFADADPMSWTSELLAHNAVELALPQQAWRVTADWSPASSLLMLELWGQDASGRYARLDSLQASGAAAGRQTTSQQPLKRLRWKARYTVAAGLWADADFVVTTIDNTDWSANPQQGSVALVFRLENDVPLVAIDVRLSLQSAGSQAIAAAIWPSSESDPGSTPAVGGTALTHVTVTSTTPALYRFTFWAPGAIFRAGWYTVWLQRDNPISVPVQVRGSTIGRQNYLGYYHSDTGWMQVGPPWILVNADYTADGRQVHNADQPVRKRNGARTGTTAAVDTIVVDLWPATTPLILDLGGGDIHVAQPRLVNATTGQEVSLPAAPLSPTDTLVLDTGARRAYIEEASGAVLDLTGSVAVPAGQDEWLQLAPRMNSVTYDDPGMVSETITLQWRARRR